MKYITIKQWQDTYLPHNDLDGSYREFILKETSTREIDRRESQKLLWTELDDGSLVSGLQLVNRVRILMCSEPYAEDVTVISREVEESSEKLDHEQIIRSTLGEMIYYRLSKNLGDNTQVLMEGVNPELAAFHIYTQISKTLGVMADTIKDPISGGHIEYWVEDSDCERVFPFPEFKCFSKTEATSKARRSIESREFQELFVYAGDRDGEIYQIWRNSDDEIQVKIGSSEG